MWEVKFVDFRDYPVIGTEGLGGCSVVMLASQYGAFWRTSQYRTRIKTEAPLPEI
ncbi:uncharacterized protein BDV14DRAFT_166789 [Aspergillus stella-maris]|uniref:uncharacterized protein n=1 Tax=Aspergillus stella-maris TaxID=1810926 RepID=UPI003CCC9BC0